MSSIDRSQFGAIVARDAYEAVIQGYNAESPVFPMITDVRPCPPGLLGDKGSVISGLGELKRRRDGEPIQADTIKGTRTWYCRVDLFDRKIGIPERDLEAADASGKIPAMLATLGAQWGRRSLEMKEQAVADILEQGTIAAGDTTVFDGSFTNETDANIGFIFDGKPLFAASGNGHPLLAGTSTPFNLTVSASLTAANIETVLNTMEVTNAIDDRERKFSLRATHLVIPKGLRFSADVLLNSSLSPGGANNDKNSVQGALTPISWRYLTRDTDAWYVAALGQGGGIRCYDSGAPVLRTWFDEDTRVQWVSAETRFGACVTDWRQWYACNKATS